METRLRLLLVLAGLPELLARGLPGVPLRLLDDRRPHFPGFSDTCAAGGQR